jgi:hypothetical protein
VHVTAQKNFYIKTEKMKTNWFHKLILWIALIWCSDAVGQVNLNQGLVAYYPFNGNANDASGNGNNGQLQNGVQPGPDRFGNSNSAYVFDGINDYIRIPHSTSLNFSSAFSIALYFNSIQNSLQALAGKISYSQGIGTQFQVGLGYSSYPGVYFGLNPPATGCNTQISVNNSYVNTGTVSLSQWNCLVATFENGIQRIYLNGVLIQTANTSFSTLNQCSNSDIQIGSWWNLDPQWFKGSIDDVRIYNRALNSSEVSTLCSMTACSNWLNLPSATSYATIGDLDISGTTLTVEATFNRTLPWVGADVWQGDLVSKHTGPQDCNYLLRPGSAEITTTNGYFKTPTICTIDLNETYHVAMTYDGSTLKFYRNGYLMSQVAATGNLFLNDVPSRIGLISTNIAQENFLGYINEVRIWNVTKTQSQLQTYMNQSLPNPSSTPGLLAYYTFDNLLNDQGNPAWNLSLSGSATANQTNPNCSFTSDSCNILITPLVQPSFTAPDTVCVNAPVNILNTSSAASSYYWNFCVANITSAPSGTNLGSLGGMLNTPVYIDYVFENGNYYGFSTNNVPGKLLRLDFGSSLLNVPVVTDLGTVGGIVPNHTEGLQIVKQGSNWYVIVVGGDVNGTMPPRIVKINLGSNITNNSPGGTNWGNIGSMSYPHDLYVFEDNGTWYGLTVNTTNNTITRFNFTSSFSNTPTAVNLGNIGGLSGPTGIYAMKDNTNWYAFITNANSNTLTRLNFGSSLLNTPTGTNLGNIGGQFHTPWDIYMMKYCGENIGFLINAQSNDLVKLDFGNSILNIPTASSYGNIGNMSFPHCLSKIFRVGADLYTFITNVNNNSLTRIKFTGCNSSNIPSSTLQTPPPISYNVPGIYNINLTLDDGLPTQSAFCKQVVVLALPAIAPQLDTTICPGGAAPLHPNITGAVTYGWAPSTGLSNPTIANPIATPTITTQYILTATNAAGCSTYDTVMVNVLTPQQCGQITVTPSFTAPDTVCVGSVVNIINTSTNASSYYWSFCAPNLNATPTGVNLGNPGSQLTTPCFIDFANVNGNYYGFIISNNPASLVRLDFGNSLINAPTATNLGNFGNIIPLGAQGIQVVYESGSWYAFVTGGDIIASPAATPRIIKFDFGANITNTTPVVTNWGNIGGMAYPHDLFMFKDAGSWYGFTVNYQNSTVTRFSFGSNFSSPPVGTNLGNLGSLNQPNGLFPINDNGTWRLFVSNFGGNTISRIDFGNSLLNAPTSSVNLGSLGGTLHNPRDLYIFNNCGNYVGYLVNETSNDFVRLNFSNLAATPTATPSVILVVSAVLIHFPR